MRRIVGLAIAAAIFAACSNETTAPNVPEPTVNTTAFGSALTSAGGYDASLYPTRLTNSLPDSLKLSADQQARIKALVEAFQAATKADRDSLTALLRDVHTVWGARPGASADSVGKLIARAMTITARLAAAEAKLKSDIDGVLTADQRAWIAAHQPPRCDPTKFVPLTDAQKAQISALEKAFQDTNKADLDAVRAAFQAAEGKSQAERAAILAGVAPALTRLEAARRALTTAIANVLTPEQKVSGCLPLG
jgi:Spy/CpxP family protein refolding chaperone